MIIRRAEQKDLAQMVQIENLCFPEETAFPPGMFSYLIRYSVALVACEPAEMVRGFIIGYASVGALQATAQAPQPMAAKIAVPRRVSVESLCRAGTASALHVASVEMDTPRPSALPNQAPISARSRSRVRTNRLDRKPMARNAASIAPSSRPWCPRRLFQ